MLFTSHSIANITDRAEDKDSSTPPVLGYDTLGLTKVERSIWSGPIADDEREPRVPGASFPFAVRPMETRRPCG